MSANASMPPDARTSATVATASVIVSHTTAPVSSLLALGAPAAVISWSYSGWGVCAWGATSVDDATERSRVVSAKLFVSHQYLVSVHVQAVPTIPPARFSIDHY